MVIAGVAEDMLLIADRGIAPIGVDLVQPNWPALADAFGGRGVRVDRREALASQIQAAVAAGGMQLLHVPVAVFEPP